MSSLLYTLGRASFRHRIAMLIAWLFALAGAVGALGAIGGSTDPSFPIPGTESQDALDELSNRFPEVSGTSAQVVMVAPEGSEITDEPNRAVVDDTVERLRDVPQVALVISPFSGDGNTVADDGRTTYIQVQFEVPVDELGDGTEAALEAAVEPAHGAGLRAELGGDLYRGPEIHISIVEVIGVLVALVVLAITFRSMVAAWVPLATAIAGVGVVLASILMLSNVISVSATAPMLALMLGLAVGIDYALFIVSRHRSQLADGMDPEESVAQAVATAGSAVVFAGATVIIALCGLAVAQIPFLTVMGAAAGAAVLVAVLVALTLLPALLGFLGSRLRPRRRRPRRLLRGRRTERAARKEHRRFSERWVSVVTRWPLLTVIVVTGGLATAITPAADLSLALPDNGTAEPDSSERRAYDLVAEAFGEGYNGPLLVTADVLQTTDPVGVTEELADDLRALDGVADVTTATPNRGGDMAIVVVIPDGGPDSDATKDLVEQIRDRRDHYADTYNIDIAVTGQTALAIDVSELLARALLPFGLVVVGLSLVLLTVVFRSIAVPIKATAGYMLSVIASFGAVTAVFEWGWFAEAFSVARTGPVVSFLPIILMGVLFGLAMDYEVFLVSRMREEFVHRGDARRAVTVGFAESARVVAAAAVIMVSVFVAFVPTGDATLKPIAFALAVGVFVDAFLVRMTLVPAAMVLLGRKAWWLPRWLDRRLPLLDVEGADLQHRLDLAARWDGDGLAVRAEGLEVGSTPMGRGLDLAVPTGQMLAVEGPPAVTTPLLLALAGRYPVAGGLLRVGGHLLPAEARAVRAQVAVAEVPAVHDPRTVGEFAAGSPALGWWPRSRRSSLAAVLGKVNSSIVEGGQAVGRPAGPVRPASRLVDLTLAERAALGVAIALAESPSVIAVPHLGGDVDEVVRACRTVYRMVPADVTLLLGCTDAAGVRAALPAEQLVITSPATTEPILEDLVR